MQFTKVIGMLVLALSFVLGPFSIAATDTDTAMHHNHMASMVSEHSDTMHDCCETVADCQQKNCAANAHCSQMLADMPGGFVMRANYRQALKLTLQTVPRERHPQHPAPPPKA